MYHQGCSIQVHLALLTITQRYFPFGYYISRLYFLSKISLCITMRYCRMFKKDVKGLIRRMYESYLSEKEKVLGLQQYYRRGLQQ